MMMVTRSFGRSGYGAAAMPAPKASRQSTAILLNAAGLRRVVTVFGFMISRLGHGPFSRTMTPLSRVLLLSVGRFILHQASKFTMKTRLRKVDLVQTQFLINV